MVWEIELSNLAIRNLDDIDHVQSQRILKFLFERVAKLDDPRGIGEALRGSKLGNFWKYRVGDYRVIADIEDKVLKIVVVRIGDRRDIYKR